MITNHIHKEGLFLKAKRLILILLALLLISACAKTDPAETGTEPSESIWDLGKRYDSTYSKISHIYHYNKGDSEFFLSVMRSKKAFDSLKNVKESVKIGEYEYALCKTEVTAGEANAAIAISYVCLNGAYRLSIASSESTVDVSEILSFEEAASLMQDPNALPSGVAFRSEEWTAYYRNDSCNLEIYIYPSDGGKNLDRATDTYETREEDGETYLYSEMDLAILYPDGTDTVWIRQANRSGSEHTIYSTLAECKAILAMLGGNREG